MEAVHGLAASMNGIRTAGDLVMRLQLTRKMKTPQAKRFLAEKLHLKLEELDDVVTMTELRTQRGFGIPALEPCAERQLGLTAKIRISEELGIKIPSVDKFKEFTRWKGVDS